MNYAKGSSGNQELPRWLTYKVHEAKLPDRWRNLERADTRMSNMGLTTISSEYPTTQYLETCPLTKLLNGCTNLTSVGDHIWTISTVCRDRRALYANVCVMVFRMGGKSEWGCSFPNDYPVRYEYN